jgi:aspartyl-tRNA(Asn)/glutamyl-tRNA(Gln) amidotransferase subunit A
MSAETLLGLYARRALSPVEALKAVMERVARYNPWVNAFAAMNPQALRAAGEASAAASGELDRLLPALLAEAFGP